MFNVLGEAIQIVFARHVSVWERWLGVMSKAGVLAEPEAALPHFRLQEAASSSYVVVKQ
jgi:hypothetical protein